MSKTVNKHGVCIKDVSVIHKSFSKASCIPADDITPAILAGWERERVEAIGELAGLQFVAKLITIDTVYSGCWLQSKMRAMRTKNGKPMFDERLIKDTGFEHGRRCVGNSKTCWKIAVNAFQTAVADKETK